MPQLAVVRHRLAAYRIRAPSDYAEILVAEATNGERLKSGVNKGFDIIAPTYGRIEAKCRHLPTDGRREERVELGDAKATGFDFLAVVIFFPDLNVKGAVLVPYTEVWAVVESRKYRRINYAEACLLPGAVNIQ